MILCVGFVLIVIFAEFNRKRFKYYNTVS